MINFNNTICNIATSPISSAIAIIRMSGVNSLIIAKEIFFPLQKNINILKAKGFRFFYGSIKNNDELIDEVLLYIFKAPHSFTGENMVEISCHGSTYISNRIVKLLLEKGAILSKPGEFTQRAFLNGKIDLSQAEAVADLISANNTSSHKLALQQMRGGYSTEINNLRSKLLEFSSLIELELDFSEEDLEFADRKKLISLLKEIQEKVIKLCDSFQHGNVFKNGIPVVIVGETNVGKSTLLNALLEDEKSIITAQHGTTRDIIEDCKIINGILFRFIDTAGLRNAKNQVEKIGIQKTLQNLEKASIALYLLDIQENTSVLEEKVKLFKKQINTQKLVVVFNKIDKVSKRKINDLKNNLRDHSLTTSFISAKNRTYLEELITCITHETKVKHFDSQDIIVSNLRHYEALKKVSHSITNTLKGLNKNLPTDLITQDIREAIHYLGEITGEITSDEILQSIFSKFCIGK